MSGERSKKKWNRKTARELELESLAVRTRHSRNTPNFVGYS